MKCWCKNCGRRLYTKREYIKQQDTCDRCYGVNADDKVVVNEG